MSARARLLRLACVAALASPVPATVRAQAAGSGTLAALRSADTLRVDTVTAGLVHAYAWEADGPWAIHVLEVERGRCLALAARKAGPPITARATTSALGAGALAAVNADFFRIPEGITVGAHVEGGAVVVSPSERPVFAVARDGSLWIGRAWLRGSAVLGSRSLPVTRVNTPGATDTALALFDEWYGEPVSVGEGGVLIRLAAAGAEGRGRVASIGASDGAVRTSAGSVLLSADPAAAARLRSIRRQTPVRWDVRLYPRGVERGERAASEAVGGFPVLLERGRPAPAIGETNEGFGAARHPRTAIGYDASGSRVLLVTVDGRQPPYSDGMTLPELAGLMIRLGAVEALNLDGGGSTTMVVGGRIVNRPSDTSGERPVGNALTVRSTCR